MARSRPRSFTCRLRRREIFGRFGKKREVTAATDSFFFSSLSSLFSTSFAEWSSTYCRPSRRDINVVVTIGLLLQNGWLQKALRARDHFEREKMILFWFRICVLLLYCRDDNSVPSSLWASALKKTCSKLTRLLWLSNSINMCDFMRLRLRLVFALFGRFRWHFFTHHPFSSSVLLLSSTTEQSEQVHI